MRLLGKNAPKKIASKAGPPDAKTVVLSGFTALAVMGAVTAVSAVVSSLRAGERRA